MDWSVVCRLAVLVCVGLASAGVARETRIELPEPGGAYAVGVTDRWWTDETRRDLAVAGPLDDPAPLRQVGARFWYPATDEEAFAFPLYFPDYKALLPHLRESAASRDLVAGASGPDDRLVDSRARLDAPFAPGVRAFPLVLLSGGTGLPRASYAILAAELASHGLVVVILDHPGISLAAPDGHTSRPEALSLTRPPSDIRTRTPEARDLFWSRRNDMLVLDQLFALGEIRRLADDPGSPLYRRIDFARVAMGGHSAGFQSKSCDRSIAIVCLNYEGVPVLEHRLLGLDKPLLSLRDGKDSAAQLEIFSKMRAEAFDVVLPGSSHLSATDLEFLLHGIAGRAAADLADIAAVTLAFLARRGFLPDHEQTDPATAAHHAEVHRFATPAAPRRQ